MQRFGLLLCLLCLASCTGFRYETAKQTFLKVVDNVELDYGIEITRHNFICLNEWDFLNLRKIYSLNTASAFHLTFNGGSGCIIYMNEAFCNRADYHRLKKTMKHEILHCIWRCHETTEAQRRKIVEFFINIGLNEGHLTGKEVDNGA